MVTTVAAAGGAEFTPSLTAEKVALGKQLFRDKRWSRNGTVATAGPTLGGSRRGYQEQFRRVFGTGVTPEGVARAIAAYERTILSGNSAFDRFRAGDTAALSAPAQRGLALFRGKAGCAACHAGFNFTDENYQGRGQTHGRPLRECNRCARRRGRVRGNHYGQLHSESQAVGA